VAQTRNQPAPEGNHQRFRIPGLLSFFNRNEENTFSNGRIESRVDEVGNNNQVIGAGANYRNEENFSNNGRLESRVQEFGNSNQRNAATPAASEDSSGTSISIPLAFNFGRMLPTDEFARRKRTPQEPSSLQALLANHRIDTNVLKTRAQLRQPAQLSTILTPNRDSRPYHRQSGLRTENQRPLPDKFYTNSDIFPDRVLHPEKYVETQKQVNSHQRLSERQDLGDPSPFSAPQNLAKTTSFRDTAIIALQLSEKVMNLYKTLSPYLSGEKGESLIKY